MRFIISFTIFSFLSDIGWTKDSRESVRDNTLKEISENPIPENMEPQLNYLWSHNPMTQMMLPRPSFWTRPAFFRKPNLSLTKLSKSLQNDFSPSFKQSDFGFERRNKPITLVAFKNFKNGRSQQKALHKLSRELNLGEVAEMQSPYNDVGVFWREERVA